MTLKQRLMKLKKEEMAELYAKLLKEGSIACLVKYYKYDVTIQKICRDSCNIFQLCKKISKEGGKG